MDVSVLKPTRPHARARRAGITAVFIAVGLACAPAPALAIGLAPPENTVAPAVTGTAQVGQTVSCTQGVWTNEPLFYAYRWQRNAAAIAAFSATSAYLVVQADAGAQLTCSVRATNLLGQDTATSAAVVPTTQSAGGGSSTPGGTPSAGTPGGPASQPLPSARQVIKLPSAKRCVSRRRFSIRIRKLKGLPYASVAVYVNGKRKKVVSGSRLKTTVDLRGLPTGRFSAKIVIKTTDGRKISHTRSYRTCATKRTAKKRKHQL